MTDYQGYALTDKQLAIVGALAADARRRYDEGDSGALRHSVALKLHDPWNYGEKGEILPEPARYPGDGL
jgi:hypothetical protein